MRDVRVLLLAGLLLATQVAGDAQSPSGARPPAPAPSQPPAAEARRPASPPPPGTVPAMPRGNPEHGRYLAEHVAMCVECHSGRDNRGNIVEALKFMGAPIPVRPDAPNDWALRAPRNRGLPGYTDELAMRLLTQGAIDRDGNQLRPPMPRFRMAPQDAADVIAFLRSLDLQAEPTSRGERSAISRPPL